MVAYPYMPAAIKAIATAAKRNGLVRRCGFSLLLIPNVGGAGCLPRGSSPSREMLFAAFEPCFVFRVDSWRSCLAASATGLGMIEVVFEELTAVTGLAFMLGAVAV